MTTRTPQFTTELDDAIATVRYTTGDHEFADRLAVLVDLYGRARYVEGMDHGREAALEEVN